MSTIRDKLQTAESEAMRRHLFDLELLVMSAEHDLEVARARHAVAMRDFKEHLGFDISDVEKRAYDAALNFLKEVEDEKAA